MLSSRSVNKCRPILISIQGGGGQRRGVHWYLPTSFLILVCSSVPLQLLKHEQYKTTSAKNLWGPGKDCGLGLVLSATFPLLIFPYREQNREEICYHFHTHNANQSHTPWGFLCSRSRKSLQVWMRSTSGEELSSRTAILLGCKYFQVIYYMCNNSMLIKPTKPQSRWGWKRPLQIT